LCHGHSPIDSGEEKPNCTNCERQGESCDYSIRLNWNGRSRREHSALSSDASSTAAESPYQATFSFQEDVGPLFPPTPGSSTRPSHVRSRSNVSPPRSNNLILDPALFLTSQSTTPPVTSNVGSHVYHESGSRMPSRASYTPSHFQSNFGYPALSAASHEPYYDSNNGLTSVNMELPQSPPLMLPPRDVVDSKRERHKKSHSMHSPTTTMSDAHSPYTGPLDPYSPFMAMPLTPSSSASSEENIWRSSSTHQSPSNPPPDLRRMSVQSIINNDFSEHSHGVRHGRQYPTMDFSTTIYGYDLGLPDLDTPNNDDFSAIALFSPQASGVELDECPYGNGDTRGQDMAFESGGYYAKPVAIRISKSLGVLPPILLENHMNLLYFHHFLNHTARILVPHDCERNPFRQILPKSRYTSALYNRWS
jgi:hypothetical protein